MVQVPDVPTPHERPPDPRPYRHHCHALPQLERRTRRNLQWLKHVLKHHCHSPNNQRGRHFGPAVLVVPVPVVHLCEVLYHEQSGQVLLQTDQRSHASGLTPP